jgi:predicted PhzF superfamily epimerase YddE/YHI9
LVFEELAGLVPMTIRRDAAGAALGATLTAPQPFSEGASVAAPLLARSLGLAEADVATARHAPLVGSVHGRSPLSAITNRADL